MRGRRTPQRSCIGCRAGRDQRDLLRLVRSPDGTVAFDERQRLPGRGAYICPTAECAQRALRPKVLDRVFRHPVSQADLVPLQAAVADHLQSLAVEPAGSVE